MTETPPAKEPIRTHSCGGKFLPDRVVLSGYFVDALRCDRCDEIHMDPKQTQLVLAHKNYKARVFDGTITTSGPSTAIRVEKLLAREFALMPGDGVQIRAEAPDRLTIQLGVHIQPAVEQPSKRVSPRGSKPETFRVAMGYTTNAVPPRASVTVLPPGALPKNLGVQP